MATNNGNASAATSVTPPSTTAFINLSDYMYQAYDTPYKSTPLKKAIGFTALLRPSGKPVYTVNFATGLYAEAFVSTAPGTKQVVIAYEGTQLAGALKQSVSFSAAEIEDDSQLFAGAKANSLDGSASFAQKVISYAAKQGIGTQNIYVTGHSLGAAEADYAASQTGLAGVTFAAPGISTAYTGVYPNVPNAGKVVNYVDGGDPIGNYAADGANTLAPVLTSDTIKHYGGVDVLPNAGGQNSLRDAADLYGLAKAANSTVGKDAALAGAILVNGHDHLLPQYAQDLGYLEGLGKPLPLYLSDGSTNADTGFFPSASNGTSQASVDTSYIAAALTGGGMSQSSGASSSASNASVLAASSAAMGVKAHHVG